MCLVRSRSMPFLVQSAIAEAGRICVRCKKFKPWDDFQLYARGVNGRRACCSLCLNKSRKKYDDARAEYMFGYHLKRKFNITLAQYRALEVEQGGVCRLCRAPEVVKSRRNGQLLRLAVDHDHRCCPSGGACGKCIRGLLCWRCNSVVGMAESAYGALVLPQIPAYVDSRPSLQ